MVAVSLPRAINRPMVTQAARPAFEIRHLFRLVGSGADAVRAFTVILIVGAILGLLAAHFRARENRRADLTVMWAPSTIRLRPFWRTVAENLILTGAGAGLGLAAAHGVAWRAGLWLWEHNRILLSFARVDGEALLVLTVLGLCALAALPATIRAARIDVSRVLSGG